MSASPSARNIRLARTKDRWDEYMYYAGVAETIGVPVNMLTPEQVKEIWPLARSEAFLALSSIRTTATSSRPT